MSIPVDRREFLRMALLATAAPVLAQHESYFLSRPLPPAAARKKILILGAGLAGLAAGYELARAGHEITILEAQMRPGGRVLTLREPFSDGLYAEAGAGRIPDSHDLTMHYVRHFGLTLVPFYPDRLDRVLCLRGKRVRLPARSELKLAQLPFDFTREEQQVGMSGLEQKYLGPAMRKIGDPSSPDWPVGVARSYDTITMTEFLREQGASLGAIQLLDLPFATASDDRISFLFNLREAWYASHEKIRYKIKGGNDLLPRAFAAKLKEKIHYGTPVIRIEQDATKVRAIALQSGSHQTFGADRLICTIPFPALRRVEVEPPFSDSKQKAISELAYDTITRVIYQCRSRYWEQDGFNGFGISDLEQEIWHPTFDQPGPRGLLVSYMCLSAGQRAGAMDDDKRLVFVSDNMDKVHPGLRQNLEGVVTKVWHTDPWVGGATALPSPGQMTSICVGIEKPEGRVHFAGEHTSRFQGWMQGALQSGLRAAREVTA
jgi:monoamine oxidase